MTSGSKERITFTPEFLERYTVKRLVGEGGSGAVYEAEQKSLGRVVAVKFLSNHLFREEEAVQRFLDEGKITARLQHANIVTIYDYGVMDGIPYAVFEFISGKPLRAKLDEEKRFSVTESLRITQETLAGLSHAHKLGVVHRDLKPENLLLEPDGRVKIADFGLAKSHEKRDYKTRAGVVLGTPEYISPEQASGQEALPQSDLYALGIMLYEMLSGTVPFAGTSDLAILIAHVQKPPRPLPELLPGVPSLVWELTSRALEKQPDKRFASADEFFEKLDELQPYVGRSTREVPSTVVKIVRASSAARPAAKLPAQELRRGNRLLAGFGLGLAGVVFAAAAGAYLFRSGSGGKGYSVEGIRIVPGVHTASLEWRSSTAIPGAVEVREEQSGTADDWRKVPAPEGDSGLDHRLVLGELKPATSYQFRFAYPDGTSSIQRSFQTATPFVPEGIEAVYSAPDKVAVTLRSPQPVALSLEFPGHERLEAPSETGQTHTLRVAGVDALRGIQKATLVVSYPGGEKVEAPLTRVPSLPEVLVQDIDRLDLPALIQGLDHDLATIRDAGRRQAALGDRLKKERFYATFQLFREIASAFFQTAQIPQQEKLNVYERLLALEHIDALAALYQIRSPLLVAASYVSLVARVYKDPLPAATEYETVKSETREAAFFPENFSPADLAKFRDSLEIVQGKGRSKETFRFTFQKDPERRFVRAALVCKASNLPPRMYFEALLNDRLRLVFRTDHTTYSGPLHPALEMYVCFPTSFLAKPENKVELKLKVLPGLQPIFNALLYEFGIKAE